MGKNALSRMLSGPVARGSVVSMGVRLTGLALATLQAILTARLLGPAGYGTVAYVMSLSMIVATVVLFGTQPLAVREVARLNSGDEPRQMHGFLSAIRRLRLVLTGLFALIWVVGTLTLAEHPFPMVFVALIFPVFASTFQMQGILRGFGNVALAQVPHMILRPLILVGVLGGAALFSIGLSPLGFLVAAFCAAVLAGGLSWLGLRPLIRGLPASDRPGTRPLIQAATPFLIISLVSLFLGEINTLMLALWAGPAETGLFQPIARITPVLMLAMQSVAVRYGPRVSELWSTGQKDHLRRITHKATLVTTGFTLLASVALVVLADPILGLFGPAFTQNAMALTWVAAAQVFNAACGPVGLLLTMSDKARAAVWPQIAALIVNLVLGALLIPGMGAMGAAIALASGIVVWNFSMLIAVRRRMGFDPSLIGALRAAD